MSGIATHYNLRPRAFIPKNFAGIKPRSSGYLSRTDGLMKPINRRSFMRIAGMSLGAGALHQVLPTKLSAEGNEIFNRMGMLREFFRNRGYSTNS